MLCRKARRRRINEGEGLRDAAITQRATLNQAVVDLTKPETVTPASIEAKIHASDGLLASLNATIERMEGEVSRERWRLFLLGFPIYLLLGGFFAAAFAQNFIQAVAVGFGWTAVADRFGLQKELATKKQLTTEQITHIEKASLETIQQLKDDNQRLTKALTDVKAAMPPQ